MTRHVSVDFETRSRIDLKKDGLDRYARDPSTSVLCLAYMFEGSAEVGLWVPNQGIALPRFLEDPNVVIHGWNCSFERNILEHVLGISVPWSRFRDTMAWSGANNLPQSLEDAGLALGTIHQKDPIGKRLIQKLCKPRKDGTFNDDPELLHQLYEYCKLDVRTEAEIATRLRPLSDEEQRIWELTQEINGRGVPVDPSELWNAIQAVRAAKAQIDVEIKAITGGVAATQPAALTSWLVGQGVSIGDMTAETVQYVLFNQDMPDNCRRVLELRQQGSSTSVAKFETMLRIQIDGRIRNMLVYHGASTGRWASRGGLNMQNLARPVIDGDAIEDAIQRVLERGGDATIPELISIVRGAVRSPSGTLFCDADFSSVENRVGVWIAGQKDKLELFRQGKLDEYKVFASESLFHVPYDQVTKEQRQFAKPGILGGMFGQGGTGLVGYARGMGVEMTEEEGDRVTKAYRADYYKVKSCWYQLEDLAVLAIQNPGTPFGLENGKIVLKLSRGALWMRLPSGRLICWQRAELRDDITPWGKRKLTPWVFGQNTFTRKWGMNKLIGSSIFQSAVQATARDLLSASMLRLDADGFDMIVCFHDEILALVPEGDAERQLGRMVEVMTTNPDWGLDLPLAAEGWVGTRFRK